MASCDATPVSRERFITVAMCVIFMGVLADQVSKHWACIHAAEPRTLVPGYVVAYAVENAGCILGFGGEGAGTNSIVILLSIAVAVLMGRIACQDRRWWRGPDCLAAALIFAGIFGNMLDRLTLGHVRDFLVTWVIPTIAFNVADLLAVAGGTLLFSIRYRDSRRARAGLGFSRPAAA
jgi:signal peptidase II